MHTVQELEALPTISSAQCDDLKIETPTERVWLSRMTPDDGEIFQIHHESLVDGRWIVTSEYAPFAEPWAQLQQDSSAQQIDSILGDEET